MVSQAADWLHHAAWGVVLAGAVGTGSTVDGVVWARMRIFNCKNSTYSPHKSLTALVAPAPNHSGADQAGGQAGGRLASSVITPLARLGG